MLCERRFEIALERLLTITPQRDLDSLERVEWHKAVAECLRHGGDAPDVGARRLAALQAFDEDEAARVLPLLAA